MTMARLPKSADKPVSRIKQPKRRRPAPKLNAVMPCDTAFRIIAQRHLKKLSASHEATCKGDPTALHEMRIALTHLRTAILFFSPMVADTEQTQVAGELKWLNAKLGAVRDLDVAIERLRKMNRRQKQASPDISWS